MDWLNKLTDFFKGNRTYLIALVGAAVGIAGALGYAVPQGVLEVLAFLGLYTLRAGVAATEVRVAARLAAAAE